MPTFLHLTAFLAVSAYAVASYLFIRAFWLKSAAVPARWLMAGAIWHAAFLLLAIISPQSVGAFSFFTLASSLILVGIFLTLLSRHSLWSLGAFVSPMALFFFSFSGIVFHTESSKGLVLKGDLLLNFHILCTMAGVAVFSLACGVSLAVLFEESLLKKRTLHKLARRLPPIASLESLSFRLLYAGIATMLAGIASGFYLTSGRSPVYGGVDPLLFASCLALTIYFFIVVGSKVSGLRGRRAAWLSVCGYLVMLVSLASASLIENLHVYR